MLGVYLARWGVMSSSSPVQEIAFLMARRGQIWTFTMSLGLKNGLELL